MYKSNDGKTFITLQDPYLTGTGRGYYVASAFCPDDAPDKDGYIPVYQRRNTTQNTWTRVARATGTTSQTILKRVRCPQAKKLSIWSKSREGRKPLLFFTKNLYYNGGIR